MRFSKYVPSVETCKRSAYLMKDGLSIMYGGLLLMIHATCHLPLECMRHYIKMHQEKKDTQKVTTRTRIVRRTHPTKGTEHTILTGLEKEVLVVPSTEEEPDVAGILVAEQERYPGQHDHYWEYIYIPGIKATEQERKILKKARQLCVPFWDSKLNLDADYR